MKSRLIIVVLLWLSIQGCVEKTVSTEAAKKEILETEKAFNDLAQKEGIQAAFLHFAADSAVLMRNNQLIFGKDAIQSALSENTSTKNVTLTWKPDFVDVSASGDLGYTYGTYIYSYQAPGGEAVKDTGIFHTVWKLQPNGEWRFVWD